MGCGQSRDVQTPISHLGSHGSSAEDDDVVKRTWGSPAPILPSINGKSLVYDEDEPFPVPLPGVPTTKGTGGVAFYVGEEQPAKMPPRRLQTLNANRLSMDELLRKQREAEMRHNQHLQDKMKSSEEHKSKRRMNEKKGFDKAMAQYNEIEKKLERGDEKRKSIIKQKVEKTRLHHAKVSEVRRRSITDEGLEVSCNIEADTEYNKSESKYSLLGESWDNESIKNIYDQMEYITPVSGLTKNTLGNESDEDFFS